VGKAGENTVADTYINCSYRRSFIFAPEKAIFADKETD
jgi:hypothetical protein